MSARKGDRPRRGGGGGARPESSGRHDPNVSLMLGPGGAIEFRDAATKASVDGDRAWFTAHPGRRFRLRPACPAEQAAIGAPCSHILVEQLEPRVRRRHLVFWRGALPPDCDTVLARLLADGHLAVMRGGRA
jgi:hypothetical protein